jgi:RNA polymerase sigma-70 factor (ECF subfamily)
MVITDDQVESTDAAELLSRARQGDAQAFCLLLEPLQTRLLRQAAALAGDLSAAEDLVSETLVEAWKSLPRYNEACRLSTWLYAILLHRYQKSLRHARSRPMSLAALTASEDQELRDQQENIPGPDLSPVEAAAQSEALFQLKQCIERLPEKHRNVILLRFFEDASLPDMAAVLGCSVGTVKSRLHHALEKLRKMKMNLPDPKGDQQV